MATLSSDPRAALLEAKSIMQELMESVVTLHSESLTLAEREAQLLALCQQLGRIQSTSHVDLTLAMRILQDWGLNQLFTLVDGGMRLAPGEQVFSFRLYASLYQIAKAAIDSSQTAAPDIYEWLLDLVKKYVATSVVPAFTSKSGAAMFAELRRRWEDHKIITEWMRRLFKSLDDTYSSVGRKGPPSTEATSTATSTSTASCTALAVKGGVAPAGVAPGAKGVVPPPTKSLARSAPTITSASLQAFKEAAFDARKGTIGDTVLDFIVRDRAGESVDRSEVHSILELFVVMGVCLSKDDFKDRKEVESVTQLAERGTASVTLKEGDVYVVDFEHPFLAVSAEWYRSLGNAWAELPSSEYAARVEECIRAEEERVRVMMHVETRAKLMATLTANMIAPHVNVILNKEGSGVVALLKRGEASFADIAAIYRVVARVGDGTRKLAAILKEFVVETGRAYTREREERFKAAIDGVPAAATGPGVGGVEAAAAAIATVVRKKGKVDPDDPTFIIPIVDMHARHARLVKEFCAGDKDCWRALKEAMEDLCNRKLEMETQDAYEAITIPSFIDTFTEYLDNVLSGKTSAKSAKLSSEDIDKTWKAALALFPYLHEKDVFKDAYRHALAKRLLNERCESVDSERAVVSELKSQSGNQFHQCEVMINNLTTQSDFTKPLAAVEKEREAYNKSHATATISKTDLATKVLDKAAWPTFMTFDKIVLPYEIDWYLKAFTAGYKKHEASNERKKLEWQFGLGTADVVFKLGAGKDCKLSVSTLQMLILLIFNETESMRVTDIATKIGIEVDKVVAVIGPFTVDKRLQQQVLTLDGSTKPKKPSENDIVRPNMDFHKNKRLVYSVPRVDLEGTASKAKTVDDRKFAIDAALVRVMKSRKTLKFEELIGECSRQLTSFKVEPRDVRRRIEDLIVREYFERDSASREILHYMA